MTRFKFSFPTNYRKAATNLGSASPLGVFPTRSQAPAWERTPWKLRFPTQEDGNSLLDRTSRSSVATSTTAAATPPRTALSSSLAVASSTVSAWPSMPAALRHYAIFSSACSNGSASTSPRQRDYTLLNTLSFGKNRRQVFKFGSAISNGEESSRTIAFHATVPKRKKPSGAFAVTTSTGRPEKHLPASSDAGLERSRFSLWRYPPPS